MSNNKDGLPNPGEINKIVVNPVVDISKNLLEKFNIQKLETAEMPEIVVYKIINAEGKFSTGGYHPRWTSKGKTWSQFNHVKSHLRQQFRYLGSNLYQNCIPDDWTIIKMSSVTGITKIKASTLYPETITN